MYIKRQRCKSFREDLQVDMLALVAHLEAEINRLMLTGSSPGSSAYDAGARQVAQQDLEAAKRQRAASIAIFSRLPHCKVSWGGPGGAVSEGGDRMQGEDEGAGEASDPESVMVCVAEDLLAEHIPVEEAELCESRVMGVVSWAQGSSGTSAWKGRRMTYVATGQEVVIEEVHTDAGPGGAYVSVRLSLGSLLAVHGCAPRRESEADDVRAP